MVCYGIFWSGQLKRHHFFIKDAENRRNLLNLSCKDKRHAYAGE